MERECHYHLHSGKWTWNQKVNQICLKIQIPSNWVRRAKVPFKTKNQNWMEYGFRFKMTISFISLVHVHPWRVFFRSPSWVSTPSGLRQDTRSSAEFKVWSSENLVNVKRFGSFESKKLQQFFKKCILLSISMACFWEACLFNTHTKVKGFLKTDYAKPRKKMGLENSILTKSNVLPKLFCHEKMPLTHQHPAWRYGPELDLASGFQMARCDNPGWFKPCNRGKHVIPINQHNIFSCGSRRYKVRHLQRVHMVKYSNNLTNKICIYIYYIYVI